MEAFTTISRFGRGWFASASVGFCLLGLCLPCVAESVTNATPAAAISTNVAVKTAIDTNVTAAVGIASNAIARPATDTNVMATVGIASNAIVKTIMDTNMMANVGIATNAIVKTAANTNAMATVGIASNVTAKTESSTNTIAKTAANPFPPEKEVVVVTSDDCCLMSGPQKLALVPARALLAVETLKGAYANVNYQGTNGWIALEKCFRLGRGPPPAAEIYCRKALTQLASNNLVQARLNLFIASALEPADRSYDTFYQHLTSLERQLADICRQFAAAQGTAADAERKSAGADFLQKGSGLGDSKITEARKQTAQVRQTEAKQVQDEVGRLQEKAAQDVRSLSSTMGARIKSFEAEGLVHMAVFLNDYKRTLARDPRYSAWLAATNFPTGDSLDPLRKVFSESDRQYDAGMIAISSNKIITAARAFAGAVQTWPKNKLAARAKENTAPVMAQIERMRKQIQELKQANDLLELESLFAAIVNTTKDFEGVEEMAAQNRKTLEKAKGQAAAAQQCLEEQKPFEAQELLKQAAAEWKLNPEIKTLNDRLQEKFAAILAVAPKIQELEKSQSFAEGVTFLQGFKTQFPKDPVLLKMETDLQTKNAQRQEDCKKAQALEKANKAAEALEIYARRNFSAEAKRLGRQLGKQAEKKGEKEKAITFYELGGLPEDAKRLRPKAPEPGAPVKK